MAFTLTDKVYAYHALWLVTEFVRMLNEMRLNDMSPRTIEKFRSLSRTPSYADNSIEPTRL